MKCTRWCFSTLIGGNDFLRKHCTNSDPVVVIGLLNSHYTMLGYMLAVQRQDKPCLVYIMICMCADFSGASEIIVQSACAAYYDTVSCERLGLLNLDYSLVGHEIWNHWWAIYVTKSISSGNTYLYCCLITSKFRYLMLTLQWIPWPRVLHRWWPDHRPTCRSCGWASHACSWTRWSSM